MPRLRNAAGLDPKGLYEARPLVGHGFYALTLVEPSEAVLKPPETYEIKLDAALCRKLRARSKPGETLRQQVERLLTNSL